jgi:lipopolysaccharide biosynthesis regulator YciM
MEFEPWWLAVLPLLFIAGWLARGVDRRLQSNDAGAAPRSMFRGLNLLLNEKPDQAIDAFIEVVRLDPETIELHYALGNLFRRRGEIDRAVRIHNYLLNRADLPARERATALAELAQDYLKGGLLDRAEEAFGRLRDQRPHRFAALRALLSIYEMEGEWSKAIEIAATLEKEAGETHSTAIAHFHCELAQRAIDAGDDAAAQHELDRALAANRQSVRALALQGDLQARRGDRRAAVGGDGGERRARRGAGDAGARSAGASDLRPARPRLSSRRGVGRAGAGRTAAACRPAAAAVAAGVRTPAGIAQCRRTRRSGARVAAQAAPDAGP